MHPAFPLTLLQKAGRLIVGLLVLCMCTFSWALEGQVKTTLLVPESKGVAKKIYGDVVAGIQSNENLDVSIINITTKTTSAEVESQLASQPSELIIAVGNSSYRLCKELDVQSHKVAGGISGAPNGIPTVSLTAAPETAFQELMQLAPHVKEVRVVYNENINGWWYKQAQAAGEQYGLQVIGYEAEDIKQGVQLYGQLLDDAKPKTTAVWIPLRSIVPSKTVLPLLLEKAWEKKLSIISNNPSHTRLGGLLALYPNHFDMGAQLAEFAIEHVEGVDSEIIEGTQSVRSAINLRTSSHIGLRLNKKDSARFDRIYPSQR